MAEFKNQPNKEGYSTHTQKTYEVDAPVITEIYEDATYTFICKTSSGTALSTSEWQVKRVTNANGNIRLANGNSNYDSPATNLAVVQGLSYS